MSFPLKNKMKEWFSKKGNVFFILILAFVLYQKFPVLKNNFSHQDKALSSREVRILNDRGNNSIVFPSKDSRAIAIFWATWCGPCKIEMNRLKESVESGAIPKESLFAINPFESGPEVLKFIQDNQYPFTFIESSTIASELNINVTPTTLFIEKGMITKMSSGMSVWGIWEAELFL